jgi:hypothetical protein
LNSAVTSATPSGLLWYGLQTMHILVRLTQRLRQLPMVLIMHSIIMQLQVAIVQLQTQ